jgi:ribosomal protein L24E
VASANFKRIFCFCREKCEIEKNMKLRLGLGAGDRKPRNAATTKKCRDSIADSIAGLTGQGEAL